MAYRIAFTSQALEQLAGLPRRAQQRVVDKVSALADNPELKGTRKLAGTKDGRRLAVGEYRVLYRVLRVRVLVLVVKVGARKDVYRRILRLFGEGPDEA